MSDGVRIIWIRRIVGCDGFAMIHPVESSDPNPLEK
jgi:hypothetical protein